MPVVGQRSWKFANNAAALAAVTAVNTAIGTKVDSAANNITVHTYVRQSGGVYVAEVPGYPIPAGATRCAVTATGTDTALDLRSCDLTVNEPCDARLDLGQSNNGAGSPSNAIADVGHASLYEMSAATNGLILAVDPLAPDVPVAACVGSSVAFFRDWYIPDGRLAAGRKAVIIPAWRSATGFSTGHWLPGEFQRVWGLWRARQFLAERSGNTIKMIVWRGGESDAGVYTQTQYAALLDALIAEYRAALGSSIPVLIGGLVPAWVGADAGRLAIQAALTDTPNRIANCAFVDGTGLDRVDEHYTADGQRGVCVADVITPGGFAEREYAAYESIVGG